MDLDRLIDGSRQIDRWIDGQMVDGQIVDGQMVDVYMVDGLTLLVKSQIKRYMDRVDGQMD